MSKKWKGFTLVELMFVLVIIALIMALLIPNAMRAMQTADSRTCQANIRAIDAAISMCYAETRDYTSCDTFLELAGYLPDGLTASSCPFGDTYNIDTPATAATFTSTNTTNHFAAWPPTAAHL